MAGDLFLLVGIAGLCLGMREFALGLGGFDEVVSLIHDFGRKVKWHWQGMNDMHAVTGMLLTAAGAISTFAGLWLRLRVR
jgi:hypothetical protein